MLKIKAVRPALVTMLASAFLLLGFNSTLWLHIASITESNGAGMMMRLAFALLIVCAFNLFITLFSFRWTLKPALMLLFVISAGAAYFMNEYGVMIDVGMIRNVAQTDTSEVQGLLSPSLLGYLLALGVLPAYVLWKTPIRYSPWPQELIGKGLIVLLCASLMGGVSLLNYKGLSSLFRNHHELRLMVVPSNVIGASISYAREGLKTAQQPFMPIAQDARLDGSWARHSRKSLTVLVVGESARAANFGILGYPRDTTPELNKEEGLVAFSKVTSCGTETAVSVPCMFSNMGRQDYDVVRAKNQEGLLDVLKRAGLAVIWRDNQSGCKGTCDRVTLQDVSKNRDPVLCANHECRDEILLQDLQPLIDHLDQDTVLILHQMGSHGPEYFKRYPRAFERFTPVCQSNALEKCSRESIVNAYDNTIAYTDHVLASLIDVLRRNADKVDSAMIYLADHGESLGEYNLYLHGTPYLLAPDEQKHVPMITWFSDGYQRSFQLDSHCLQAKRDNVLSQDNLFHSLLGLLKVNTQTYEPSLDLFTGCRAASPMT
ncbi:Phosphoethanolamine transferase EptA [Pseudomonas fluorescens]|uniref:phosphoethanolamine transferase n=1 Tax=Pseudomonas fluorescens TaxID=294 RepID=UPI001256AE52|nr:phosphoethanolamine--lipid A transferase [Pseudomonas fluorescens]CAG8865602.1 Phosphoethanolamine transferase EptA [Pseudomonas fluorescens]